MEQDSIADRELPSGIEALLGPYLVRQRWYAGDKASVPEAGVVEAEKMVGLPDGQGSLWWAIVSDGANQYQVLIGERPASGIAEHVKGPEDATLGTIGDNVYFDAFFDNELAVAFFDAVAGPGGSASPQRARPLSAEQSNTSVVYDDRVILKLFRRLADGPNQDVAITCALSEAGFSHIAQPVVKWQRDGRDLAFGQQFLPGASDGWALALTSLRDYYASHESGEAASPGLSGGDFAAEVTRLGQVTAEMHMAMADAFGASEGAPGPGWQDFVGSLAARLGDLLPERAEEAAPLFERLRAIASPGPTLPVHGDYHLGQVLRSDTGWYVLDFEGEPHRDVRERGRPSSALKDVAGMLRSLQYAARYALRDRTEGGPAGLEPLALAWEDRNRAAFVRGYYETKGIDELLPVDVTDREAVRVAFELDKALYEMSYEQAYRPAWVDIPRSALERMISTPFEQLFALPNQTVGAQGQEAEEDQ